jgi:MFS family permease
LEALRVYRGLLANRPLTKLLVGEFVSGIGDWLYIVAIFVVIYRESNDALAVGAFGAARLLPYVLLSVPAGIVADRFDRRLILITSDLVRFSVMVILTFLVVFDGPVAAIILFAMVAACGSTFFYPAIGAYLPSLATDERQLGPANSAWASLGELSFIVGPAIGGLLIAAGGLVFAFIVNAATFLVVAAILWTLPPSIPNRQAKDAPAADTTADGAADATGAPDATHATEPSPDGVAPAPIPSPEGRTVPLKPMAGLALVQVIEGFIGGAIQASTIILAVTVLNAGEAANGYLNAALGVGGLIGAIASGVLVLRRGLGTPMLVGALVTGVGLAVLGAGDVLGIALVAIAAAAAGAIVVDVVLTTIFQRLVPDELRGRVMGGLMTVDTLAGAVGALTMPVLIVGIGAFPALATLGVVMVAGAGVALVLLGSASTRSETPFEATLVRVARLPIFAGVPAARLEAALHQVRPVEVLEGQSVIRQGDPASLFYIIQSGLFTVRQSQDGGPETELRRLGPDEVFGEIGLLNQAPRSATVTALENGVVLEMDGDDFLELVGASGDLRGRLLGLYSSGTSRA